MELTKEYFDSKLSGLATKADLERFATKADIASLETRLIAHTDERVDELARMVQRGFEDMAKRLDFGEDIADLKEQMHEVRQELNLA